MFQIPDTEEAAQEVLLRTGVLQVPVACPVCGRAGVRKIRRNQFRCHYCRHEWSLRRGSILEGTKLSFRKFLSIARFFADDIPANDTAQRLGISYNTVYAVYLQIRHVIAGTILSGKGHRIDTKKTRTAGTGSSGKAGHSPLPPPHAEGSGTPPGSRQVVFGIRLMEGTVVIEPVQYPDPDIITSLPVPTIQRGNIHFIDAYGKRYQGFITYHPDRNGKEVIRIRARRGMPWSPLAPFWDFASRNWMSHRGLSHRQIPEYVLELAFRYNNRDQDLLPVILELIACSGNHEYPAG
jgi:transposase-like protein